MWNKNTNERIFIILQFFIPKRRKKIESEEQRRALQSDGESPAKKTKIETAKNSKKSAIFRFPNNFLVKKLLMLPKSDKCIPESAKMWERPEFLNAVVIFTSVYSRIPVIKASKSAPEAPQAYNNLLNWRRKRLRM